MKIEQEVQQWEIIMQSNKNKLPAPVAQKVTDLRIGTWLDYSTSRHMVVCHAAQEAGVSHYELLTQKNFTHT